MWFRMLWVALFFTALLAPSAQAKKLSWALYEDPCNAPGWRVEAGAYGVFVFDAPLLSSCYLISSCSETLRVYPTPGPTPLDGSVACLPGDGCHKGILNATEPWIYILDYFNAHGFMVQSLIQRSTDSRIRTVLEPLEDETPGCESINDADVLIKLAELAEAIDHQGTPAPLVINKSFGRKYEDDDARSASCNPSGGQNCAGSLSCQIARLLAHLTRPHPDKRRSVAVAAFGNHSEPDLFPAGLAEVRSAGMLDLTRFAADGTVVAAQETPAGPDALMPGNGHCLRLSREPPPAGEIFEPAPAGSSFSAALFSGMVAALLVDGNKKVQYHLDAGPLWQPYRACTDSSCPFMLRHGSTVFKSPSLAGSHRIHEILKQDIAACGRPNLHLATIEAEAMLAQDDPFLYDSLIDAVGSTHQPAPDCDPCVPCLACCQHATDSPVRQIGSRSSGAAAAADGTTTIELTIDLHSGWYFYPGFDLTLLKLYLRVGSELLELEISTPDLNDLATGKVRLIEIHGTVPVVLDWSEQPSLVALLSWEDQDNPGEIIVWDSTAMVSFTH